MQRHNVDLVPEDIQTFLDNFWMNRIGIRFIFQQHLALFDPQIIDSPESQRPSDIVGSIDPDCDVVRVAQQAVDAAKQICWDVRFFFS